MHHDLPTGTVTFVFTDVEGSTRLIHELGSEKFAEALSEHRRAVRAAIREHGGVEVDTQGDAFFLAFNSASAAVAAASHIQEATAASQLRVRVGLHTGEPLITEDGYVGLDVHRAARIAATAHGGQTILSARTAEAVGSSGLHDLGPHRLKDLSEPERLYQLGDGSFRPLKTLYRTNLPVQSSPLIGRIVDVEAIVHLVIDENARQVTLTGPGGSGKTKLAIHASSEAADSFPDGVWWVPLAAISDASLVMQTVASALDVDGDLAERIADARMLIVIDNFEHLMVAAPEIAGLLGACPRLVILATSREPLRISGEREYPVEPLASEDAVALFEARAAAINPAFSGDPTVADICRRLDYLPLAIELAAARTRLLSPPALLRRLERSLPILGGGRRDAPERQRTLRATIRWSYDLLPADERIPFTRCSVFRGGWSLDAAHDVANADMDVLQSLIDKSLARARDDRYSMLETIREFAAEQLEEAGLANEARDRHALHYLALVERAEPHIRYDSIEWMQLLDLEQDNIRTAFDHFMVAGQHRNAIRLAGNATRFWYTRGLFREGQSRLEVALAADPTPSVARIRAMNGAGLMAISLGNDELGRTRAVEAHDLADQLGERWAQAYAMLLLANVEMNWDRPLEAKPYLDRSSAIFRELEDDHFLLLANRNYALVAGKMGDVETERALHEQNLQIARARGSTRIEANSLRDLGMLAAFTDGQFEEAVTMLREAVRLDHERRDDGELSETLGRLAAILSRDGQPRKAARLLACSVRVVEAMGIEEIDWWHEMNAATRTAAVSDIGEAEFDREYRLGSEMNLDDAVHLTLGAEID